ncbi:MAG: ComF family protein, partial [Deltaproteobacteria bacterium]|nr:ComF family protein [Deltaproteobacteria bacterium]
AQVGLSREERLNNLRGSFAVKKGGCSFIEGKNILLVDDVYTTGATASICAGLLKESGAKSVSLFVLARGES